MGTANKIIGVTATDVNKIDGVALTGVSKVSGQTISLFSNTKSMDFDGTDDYIDCGAYDALDGGTTMSISVWVKPTSTDTFFMVAHNPRNVTAQQSQFMLFFYSDFIELSLSTRSHFIRSTADAITMDAWNHILCCVDLDNATEGKIYVNGGDVTANDNLQNFHAFEVAAGVMYLGKEQTGYLSPFLGNIDEFAIWDTDQRGNKDAIYNSGDETNLATLAAPPINWWRMGDKVTSFPTIPDQIGSNDGTAANEDEATMVVDDVPPT